jgi:glycerophosphoryl diester phosphodiesterase
LKENSSFFKALIIVSGILFISNLGFHKFSYTSPFKPPLFIAHASGGINGLTYLNSLEALNYNYDLGHRYFEVDFSWTSDNELVLIHDWKLSYKRLFKNESEQAPTQAEFLKMKMAFNQTQLSLHQFALWMETHPEAILIADVKTDNIKGLKKLLVTIDSPYERIIPQIYHPKNHNQLLKLGFAEKNIMYAMYRTMELTDEVLVYIKTKELFAISIQPEKDYFKRVLAEIGDSKTPIYSLTINDLEQFYQFKALGLDGTVTDFLYLKDNTIHKQE